MRNFVTIGLLAFSGKVLSHGGVTSYIIDGTSYKG